MGPRFAITTLGCKVNQYEGQAIRERLASLGWREGPFGEPADLYIVNTCTVTAKADRKCRKRIRGAIRANPNAGVIVTGCAATSSPEQFRGIPGVSAVLTREQMVRVGDFLRDGVEPQPADVFDLAVSCFGDRTRAFLKVQDGCDAWCSYCIVPRARGPVRSRPLEAVRREAERLVAAGHREIILTGPHVGHYGRDVSGGPVLSDVVDAVLGVAGVERLRLSSIEALEVTDRLVDMAAADPRLCPHFHLPLQSGDDEVLGRMRRRYAVREFLAVIERVRAKLRRPSFTTDVMVGFPGETDAQFENSLRACREAAFSRVHIFPFSPRVSTAAALLPDRVAHEVVAEREARLKALAEQLALAYKRQFVGETVRPLVEHRRDRQRGLLTGWSSRYLRVVFRGPDELRGRIAPVVIEEVSAAEAAGRWEPAASGERNATGACAT